MEGAVTVRNYLKQDLLVMLEKISLGKPALFTFNEIAGELTRRDLIKRPELRIQQCFSNAVK
jgi:hypothetical protein